MTSALCDTHTALSGREVCVENPVIGHWIPDQLVRGEDTGLIEHLKPLVQDRSVTLDLSTVERIDAAGIAALVSLYRNAREAGHSFSLTNVSGRVAQILRLVGLDKYLLSQNTIPNPQCGARVERPAA